MATRILADMSASPALFNRMTTGRYRQGLAPGKKEVQLQLADGTPLTGWITSPAAFDEALQTVLQVHPRSDVRVHYEQAL